MHIVGPQYLNCAWVCSYLATFYEKWNLLCFVMLWFHVMINIVVWSQQRVSVHTRKHSRGPDQKRVFTWISTWLKAYQTWLIWVLPHIMSPCKWFKRAQTMFSAVVSMQVNAWEHENTNSEEQNLSVQFLPAVFWQLLDTWDNKRLSVNSCELQQHIQTSE